MNSLFESLIYIYLFFSLSGEMEASCEGLDVVQETLTDDMNEGDSPFDTTTDGKCIIDEVSYYNSSYSTCVHVYILC